MALSVEQVRDLSWTVALHSVDLNGLVNYWRSVLASGAPGQIEGRLRRSDGGAPRACLKALTSRRDTCIALPQGYIKSGDFEQHPGTP